METIFKNMECSKRNKPCKYFLSLSQKLEETCCSSELVYLLDLEK